jgi:integron integrase
VLGLVLGPVKPPRLLDQMREVLRVQHYALRTEECYVQWVQRFILFHNKRHPLEMGGREIEEFLTRLAVEGNVAASTQMQAFNALVFLYKRVLQVEVSGLDAVRATRSRRLPVVLSRAEARQVLMAIEGCHGLYPLMTRLLYGAGLRLMECCRLRVKDVDMARGQLLVRQGKGDKDRVVMLPRSLRPALAEQLQARAALHERDLARGVAYVVLPNALERKYPNAVRELGWQYDVATTMIYTHVMEKGVAGTPSPLDDLDQASAAEIAAAVEATRELAG